MHLVAEPDPFGKLPQDFQDVQNQQQLQHQQQPPYSQQSVPEDDFSNPDPTANFDPTVHFNLPNPAAGSNFADSATIQYPPLPH